VSGESRRALELLRAARTRIADQERRLADLEGRGAPAIAIVGAGCRLPGGAHDLAGLARVLHNGVDPVAPIPTSRFDADSCHQAWPPAAGKSYARSAALVDDIDGFDAAFFGIAPGEAACIDPQQRMLLETAWEALEDAGLAPDRLVGSRTGVFVGITNHDYGDRLLAAPPTEISPYFLAGSQACAAAGRIAFALGLHGAAVAVDSACSSSLVAVHLACQSLRARETDLVLAGGVNAIFSEALQIALCQATMLAPDGRCKTFDDAADGYGRGEGCGTVALMRLEDAVAGGHPMLGVIRGSAINHDGRSASFTAPSRRAQEALLRAGLASAGVAPGDLDYLECHGTGTALGDPIEVQAIEAVFGAAFSEERPLVLGSVKANLAHLESAAGVAGLLRTLVALRDQTIPGNPHLRRLNGRLSLETRSLAIPAGPTPWPAGARPRRAGVSSFGYAGTNAFVVVEEPPAPPPAARLVADPRLVVLSAKNEEALRALEQRWLADRPRIEALALDDLSFTTLHGRSHFAVRRAIVACTSAEVLDALARPAPTPPPSDAAELDAAAVRALIAAPDAAATLATRYASGARIDFEPLRTAWPGHRVRLPAYPFQHRSFRREPRRARPSPELRAHELVSPFLGARRVFQLELDAELAPWLAEHRICGRAIVSASAMVSMLLGVGEPLLGPGPLAIADLDVRAPLALDPSGRARVQIGLTPEPDGGYAFELRSSTGGEWATNATGGLAATAAALSPIAPPVAERVLGGEAFYRALAGRGVALGASYRANREVRSGAGRAESLLATATDAAAFPRALHPGIVDAALQLGQVAASLGPDEVLILTGARRIVIAGSGVAARARARVAGALVDACVEAADATPLATLDGVKVRRMRVADLRAALGVADEPAVEPTSLYAMRWRPQARADAPIVGTWLVGPADAELAAP
jgi:acyl transferase domain-containing protein